MRRIWLALLLVMACGDPISGAGNCTELLEATQAAAAELPDGSFPGLHGDERVAALDDFYAQWEALEVTVEAKAKEMIGPAVERGAELEAMFCAEALEAARPPIAQVFENVAGQLGTTTVP